VTAPGGVPTDTPPTELALAECMLRDLPSGEWLATSAIAPLLAVVFAELDAVRAEITSLTHSLRQCEETAASRLAAYEGSVAEVSAQAPVVAAATGHPGAFPVSEHRPPDEANSTDHFAVWRVPTTGKGADSRVVVYDGIDRWTRGPLAMMIRAERLPAGDAPGLIEAIEAAAAWIIAHPATT